LVAVADGEKAVDLHRETLSEIAAYEPYAAFKRLARANGQSVETSDLMFFLSQNGVNDYSMFELGAVLT